MEELFCHFSSNIKGNSDFKEYITHLYYDNFHILLHRIYISQYNIKLFIEKFHPISIFSLKKGK